MSTRVPGPPGRWNVLSGPGLGAKVSGCSALTRHSMAWPRGFKPFGISSFRPIATSICIFTRSMPVTISVTGCSTWMRVFISMK